MQESSKSILKNNYLEFVIFDYVKNAAFSKAASPESLEQSQCFLLTLFTPKLFFIPFYRTV